jgi:hypothetical protein
MMLYADAIRRQAEDAPRAALQAVTSALWRAFAEGQVPEAEAEALSALIETRQAKAETVSVLRSPDPGTGNAIEAYANRPAIPDRQRSPRTGVGSRPRTDASLERRRRWAASGRLPPAIAARFTLAEQAVLALVAAETARKGDCRLSVPHLAAVAGVAETTVRNAIREAKKLGLLTVEERRASGWRNDTNVVRIVSPEWTAWLQLARKGVTNRAPLGRGGCKSPNRTPTQVSKQGETVKRKRNRQNSSAVLGERRAM